MATKQDVTLRDVKTIGECNMSMLESVMLALQGIQNHNHKMEQRVGGLASEMQSLRSDLAETDSSKMAASAVSKTTDCECSNKTTITPEVNKNVLTRCLTELSLDVKSFVKDESANITLGNETHHAVTMGTIAQLERKFMSQLDGVMTTQGNAVKKINHLTKEVQGLKTTDGDMSEKLSGLIRCSAHGSIKVHQELITLTAAAEDSRTKLSTELKTQTRSLKVNQNNVKKELGGELAELIDMVEHQAVTLESVKDTVDHQVVTLDSVKDTVDHQAVTLEVVKSNTEYQTADLKTVKDTTECQIAELNTIRDNTQRQMTDLLSVKRDSERQTADLKSIKKDTERQGADLKSVKDNAERQIAELTTVQKNTELKNVKDIVEKQLPQTGKIIVKEEFKGKIQEIKKDTNDGSSAPATSGKKRQTQAGARASRFLRRSDFNSNQEYRSYVKLNLKEGMKVRCCSDDIGGLVRGDIGTYSSLTSSQDIVFEWTGKGRLYCSRLAVEILG